MRRLAFLVGIAAVAAGCGGGGDQSASIAAKIGGTCTETSYQIIGKLDNSKTRIYDCTRGGKEMCVTQENGLVHDSTAIVRILFQGTLSGGKPGCI
jgi:hypothetical protein